MTKLAFRRRTSPKVAIRRYNTTSPPGTNVNLAGADQGMAQKKQWMRSSRAPRPAPLDASEKAVIVAACEAFIGDILKPRFLPQIRPTQWNYVIDIHGAWGDDTASCSATGRAWSTIAARSSMRPSPGSTVWGRIVSISTG